MRNIQVVGLACLVVAYVAGPVVAGATRTGDREGPVLYPAGFHAALYIIGHEAAFREKPRQPADQWMYRRPWFYGLPRRLKPEAERRAYIEAARRNHSPRVGLLIQMNQGVNDGSVGTPPARRAVTPDGA